MPRPETVTRNKTQAELQDLMQRAFLAFMRQGQFQQKGDCTADWC